MRRAARTASVARKPSAGRDAAPAARGAHAPARTPLFAPPGFGGRPAMVQAKLEVSSPSDPLEQEAERVARQVTSPAPPSPGSGQSTSASSAGHRAAAPPRISRAAAAPPVSAAAPPTAVADERAILAARAGGQPLPSWTRFDMEQRFAQDFRDVRVHAGPEAEQLSDRLGAHAFTIGSDIFFGRDQYAPGSPAGDQLLAHELTHVVQQRGGASPAAPVTVFRKAKTDAPDDPDVFEDKRLGRIERKPPAGSQRVGTIELPVLELPIVSKGVIKGVHAPVAGQAAAGAPSIVSGTPFVLEGGKVERKKGTARQQWLAAAKKADVPKALIAPLNALVAKIPEKNRLTDEHGMELGAFKPRRVSGGDDFKLVVVGSAESLAHADIVLLPVWDERGEPERYDVDHVHELQLQGFDGFENFWLWQRDTNQNAGPAIYQRMEAAVKKLVGAAGDKEFWGKTTGKKARKKRGPSFEEVRQNWRLVFPKVRGFAVAPSPGTYWLHAQIAKAEHLKQLVPLTVKEMNKLGLREAKELKALLVFATVDGGAYQSVPWSPKLTEKKVKLPDFFPGLSVTRITYDKAGHTGTLEGMRQKRTKKGQLFDDETVKVDLIQADALGFGLAIDKKSLLKLYATKYVLGLSPFSLDDAGVRPDGTFFVEGRIKPSLSIFQGFEVPFLVEGNRVELDFPVPLAGLALGPLSIDSAAVRILWDDGLAFAGAVDFSVKGVGRGRIEADGLGFGGQFALEAGELVDPAELTVAYREGAWAASAKLGLRKGKLKALKSLVADIGVDEKGFHAVGEAILAVPGLDGTRLAVSYLPDVGLDVGVDDLPIPGSLLPGVKGGAISIHVRRSPEGEWKVYGNGLANVDLFGLSGSIYASIDDRLWMVSGTVKLDKGWLSGGVSFIVTNRPDVPAAPSGKDAAAGAAAPAAPPPAPRKLPAGAALESLPSFVASGSGWATIQFGKYITGSAMITVRPDSSWFVDGEVRLPPSIPVLDEQKFRKDFKGLPEIPIPTPLGFRAFGKTIGIGLSVGADVYFYATIGPVSIDGALVKVHYDPDDESKTRIDGEASLVASAVGGLGLRIFGKLSAGIVIASAWADAALVAEAELRLEGRGKMGVHWTPTEGVWADVTVGGALRPRLRIRGEVTVVVEVDYLFDTWRPYDDTWVLGQKEFGSSLDLVGSMPMFWSEKTGLEADPSKAELKYPDINLLQLGKDIFNDMM